MNFSHFFVLFFTHAFQIFDNETGTHTISNSSDFTKEYSSVTQHVVIEDGVKKIPSYNFAEWDYLILAEIRGTLTAIRSLEFQLCESLRNITIPGLVTSIVSNPFRLCTSLQFIKVSDENANYTAMMPTEFFTATILLPSFAIQQKSKTQYLKSQAQSQ